MSRPCVCDEGCARRGGDAWWRVTASRHWCHGGVRVQRGLRGAAVMWFGRRRAVRARAGQRWRARAARRRECRRTACCASCASLAQPVASLSDNAAKCAVRQRFARKFFSKRAPGIQGCCARAGRRGELRGAEMHNVFGLSLRVECLVSKVRGESPLFIGPIFIRGKAATGPEGGIPQIAPAEHALVTGIGALFCSGTDAADPTQRACAEETRLLRTTNRAAAAPVPPS